MIPADRVYLDPGDRYTGPYDPPRRCFVLTQWGKGGGPRNARVRYLDDGSTAVIPFFRRLRKTEDRTGASSGPGAPVPPGSGSGRYPLPGTPSPAESTRHAPVLSAGSTSAAPTAPQRKAPYPVPDGSQQRADGDRGGRAGQGFRDSWKAAQVQQAKQQRQQRGRWPRKSGVQQNKPGMVRRRPPGGDGSA